MRVLQLRNQQRTRNLNADALRAITRGLLEDILGLQTYQLGVHFVSASRMAEVNQQYLQHEGSTDVITFDFSRGYDDTPEDCELAGEIFISVQDAVEQAEEFATHWKEELVRYIVHGVLHLRGFDDLAPDKRRVMKREEGRLLGRIKRKFAIADVGSGK